MGDFTLFCFYERKTLFTWLNLSLNDLQKKGLKKITVQLKSLTVIGVNSKRAGASLGRSWGGGPLYPPQRQQLGGFLQKLPETRALPFD